MSEEMLETGEAMENLNLEQSKDASAEEKKIAPSSNNEAAAETRPEESNPTSGEAKPDNNQAQPNKEEEPAEPDKALLKEQFVLFSKFGDKTADGKSIKLSQSDKWFKQAKVIDGKKITTTDTGIAFRKIAKNTTKLNFAGWSKYLEEIANSKSIHVNSIKTKLVECGKPGLSGATSIAKNAAMERLTDSSKYGGTHKSRFDSTGKGRGKEGRVDPKSDGYVAGYKNKGSYRDS